MSLLNRELINILQDDKSIKVIATVDEEGFPHVVQREDFKVLEDESIVFAEWRESSITNSNLVRAIWFGGRVALFVSNDENISYQIKGLPVRFDYVSPLYKEFYAVTRKKHGSDSDITGIWYIRPIEVRDENHKIRRKEEEIIHPYFRHLDRDSVWKGVKLH
ncbi:MAG: pyridoxamine 5'-phosphate oxidase family protein [Synergistaceae bacterium]|jgi:hypothetical protein|nr:pyridoxamine 5'-phosphate oxidase family protein [Synergistaceae bacterium]